MQGVKPGAVGCWPSMRQSLKRVGRAHPGGPKKHSCRTFGWSVKRAVTLNA
jgi:hypothetical protein